MFCLCVTNHHASVDGAEWSASRSGRCGRRGDFFRPSRESNPTSLVSYVSGLFFICFVVFSTRASPVGIPRDIYRIYFYITILCIFICIYYIFLHLLLPLPTFQDFTHSVVANVLMLTAPRSGKPPVRCARSTTDLRPVPPLRMHRTVPPLPYSCSWRT
jgi:hypothetical protein